LKIFLTQCLSTVGAFNGGCGNGSDDHQRVEIVEGDLACTS
jgi:hypothetical protein